MHWALAISQWISILWNSGFPVGTWILLGVLWVAPIDQPRFFLLLPSMEHEWKTSALICQEFHLRTPASSRIFLLLASRPQR